MAGRKRTLKSATAGATAAPAGKSFRQRYDDLEASRTQLLARLDRHMKVIRTHPSAKRALKLLNDTFRNASVAQRSDPASGGMAHQPDRDDAANDLIGHRAAILV